VVDRLDRPEAFGSHAGLDAAFSAACNVGLARS
jgi:hypothetical protein